MKTLRWLILALALGLLSACGDNTPGLTMTLTANPTEVASGATTALEATFTGDSGDVATVEFAIKDSETAFTTDDTPADGFTATSPAVSVATTFVARAKDASGAELATAEAPVTTTGPQPRAADKAVTTLAGVPVVGGGTATGLAVTTDKLVFENGTPQKVAGSETGGVAVVEANGNFTFTPADGFTGAASFKYSVGTAEGTVTVTVNALPDNTVVARSLQDLNDATSPTSTVTTIILGDMIVCDADPCIRLKTGQTLQGSGTVAGVSLSNPNAKLDANRSDAGELTTVIELAPDTTVEGLEISGEDLFSGIRGRDVDLSGTINIKDVTLVGPATNALLTIRHEDGTAFGSFYTLNVEGLTVTGANRPIGVSGFSSLNFKDSTVGIDITYAPNSAEFGLSFHAYGDATAVVENIDVVSEQGNPEFAPMKFAQSSGGGVYNLTVANNDVSFADGVDLATVNAYFFNYGNTSPTTGKIVLNAASTGNTTEASSTGATRFSVTGGAPVSSRIEGQVEVNGQLLPVAP